MCKHIVQGIYIAAIQMVEKDVSWPGVKPKPWWWERRILTTRPPGKGWEKCYCLLMRPYCEVELTAGKLCLSDMLEPSRTVDKYRNRKFTAPKGVI